MRAYILMLTLLGFVCYAACLTNVVYIFVAKFSKREKGLTRGVWRSNPTGEAVKFFRENKHRTSNLYRQCLVRVYRSSQTLRSPYQPSIVPSCNGIILKPKELETQLA